MTEVTTPLNTDARKLTVHGKGFDMLAQGMNVISSFEGQNDNARALKVKVTHTSVLLSFTHLSPLGDTQFLRVDATVQNMWSHSLTTVSKLNAVNPSIIDDSEVINSDSTTFTIRGRGFDALNSEKNAVAMVAPIKAIFDSTSKTTHTTLIVTFTHLSPVHDGQDMDVAVTVSNLWSSSDSKATKIQGVNPTVVDDGEVLSSDSSKFTIMGKGFDASNANLHTFSLSGNVKALLGSSAKSTHTSLEISFTHLSPLDAGNLNAAVTVDTTWSSSGTFQF